MRGQAFLNANPMVFKQFIPQKVFLFLGGFFGIIFLLITPPFQVPDEFQHFLQAYNLSEGRFRARLIDGRGGQILFRPAYPVLIIRSITPSPPIRKINRN